MVLRGLIPVRFLSIKRFYTTAPFLLRLISNRPIKCLDRKKFLRKILLVLETLRLTQSLTKWQTDQYDDNVGYCPLSPLESFV